MNKTSDFFDNLEIFILDTALKKKFATMNIALTYLMN